MKHIHQKMLYLLLIYSFNMATIQAQDTTAIKIYTDTVRIDLATAEKLFLEKNYLLIAQKYNIEAQRALVLQAKLFNNPSFSFETNIYNTLSKKWFPNPFQKGEQGLNGGNSDPATQGEMVWNFSQVFSLVGKRLKNTALATTNARISEYNFYDLIRNLRWQLRQNFVSLHFLQKTLHVYRQEISSIDEIIKAYDLQFNKGNIPLIEIQRLKAFQLSLVSERRGVVNQITALQNNLMILLSTNGFPYYVPAIDTQTTNKLVFAGQPLLPLIDSARIFRYDLKAAAATLTYDQQNIALQKAMGTPDLTMGVTFTRQGNYVPNYYGLTAAFDLPVFNRNQGAIRSARFTLQSDSAAYNAQHIQMEKDVWQAVTQLLESDGQFHRFDPEFASNYEKLMKGVFVNYAKKNISLLEFLDFYESYKNSVLQNNQLQSDRLNDIENLHFTIGKVLYNY